MINKSIHAHDFISYSLGILIAGFVPLCGNAAPLSQSQVEQQRLWRFCPADFIPPSLDYHPQSLQAPPGGKQKPLVEQETHVLADKAVVTDMEIFELSGVFLRLPKNPLSISFPFDGFLACIQGKSDFVFS